MNATDLLSVAGGDTLGQIGMLMLKKAQTAEAAGAVQLIQALPQSQSPGAPGVGSKLDVTA